MDSDEKPSLSWTKKLVNQHYLVNKRKYFFQCTLATIVVLVLLSTLDLISNNLIISSVASTTFVTFTCPHHKLTKARYVIGGYLVGIVVGLLCYYFMLGATNLFGELSGLADELVGAISVGASIFFMTVLNLEHPPGSGYLSCNGGTTMVYCIYSYDYGFYYLLMFFSQAFGKPLNWLNLNKITIDHQEAF